MSYRISLLDCSLKAIAYMADEESIGLESNLLNLLTHFRPISMPNSCLDVSEKCFTMLQDLTEQLQMKSISEVISLLLIYKLCQILNPIEEILFDREKSLNAFEDHTTISELATEKFPVHQTEVASEDGDFESGFVCSEGEADDVTKQNVTMTTDDFHSSEKATVTPDAPEVYLDSISTQPSTVITQPQAVGIDQETMNLIRTCSLPVVRLERINETQPRRAKCNYCDICDKTFKTRSYLATHMQSRYHKMCELENAGISDASSGGQRARKHECSICGKKFPVARELRRHLTSHSTEKSYSCDVCGKKLKNESGIKSHKKIIHGIGSVGDGETNSSTDHLMDRGGDVDESAHDLSLDAPSPYSDTKNQDRLTEDVSYSQSESSDSGDAKIVVRLQRKRKPKAFRARDALKKNVLQWYGSIPSGTTGPVCGMENKNNTRLLVHMAYKHIQQRIHACPLPGCDKRYITLSDLKRHRRTHDQQSKLPCSYCGKFFSTASYLLKHEDTIHRGLREQVPCSICDKMLSSKFSLKTHVKQVHLKTKDFVCDVCGMGFSLAGNLKDHMAVHSDEQPHVCTSCGRGFKRKDSLTSHMRTHSDVHRFTCEMCGAGFHQRHSHDAHMNKHKGVRKPTS